MRIIAGRHRGLNLAQFSSGGIRPTADRVKESLFNILYNKINSAYVLDLFCGSGNLGIESLSRGAKNVHFNDISKESLAVLKKNLNKIDDKNYKITCLDYKTCLQSADRAVIIFIDPPYATDFGKASLEIIAERRILNEGGVAVLERDKSFSGEIEGLNLYDERKYGRVYLSFFKEVEK